ncbi:MAG: hypothetical protein PVJ67_02065 [Candidatus Pacearchaeota archaeon]|jgi:hypothetical protein
MKRGIGILFFAFGILLILNSFHGLTGFAIYEKIREAQSSVFGLMFILVGVFLISLGKLEKGLMKLKTGVITDPNQLKKIARKLGYEGKMVKEGWQVLDEKGKPVTVIPRRVSRGVFYNIRDALRKGESNFRRYSYGG